MRLLSEFFYPSRQIPPKGIPGLTQLVLALVLLFSINTYVFAGTVVVRKSTEPFDAFALRDELAKQHEWQQALAQQAQLNIIRSLPVGCLTLVAPYPYYACDARFYRPYQHSGEALYIQIPNPNDALNSGSDMD
jgi:hypothetical protein